MYLFILESIGTSELLLIGLVALIVFGPRKIPELARTAGKLMAEFRRSTDDFKKTWEREASMLDEFTAEIKSTTLVEETIVNENSISRSSIVEETVVTPEIKEINQESFKSMLPKEGDQLKQSPKESAPEKRNWL